MALPSVRDAGLVWPQTAHGFSRNAAPPDKTKLIKASFARTGHFIFLPPLDGDPIAQIYIALDVQCVYETMTLPLFKLLKCRKAAFPEPIASAPNKAYRI